MPRQFDMIVADAVHRDLRDRRAIDQVLQRDQRIADVERMVR
jgi:hypothetical protein